MQTISPKFSHQGAHISCIFCPSMTVCQNQNLSMCLLFSGQYLDIYEVLTSFQSMNESHLCNTQTGKKLAHFSLGDN